MQWTSQQETALSKVKEWLNDENAPQVFRLFGYAGTGKTTLAKEMSEMAGGKICYAAFTGKAASVLRKKGCARASTIHALIYILDKLKHGEPEFILNSDSDVKHSKLVVIDECSMVDEFIGKDLLSYGTKILVIGDPAQLPPVKGTGFFTDHKPDYLLTEVHRQALENPIIGLSMKIRAGERLALGEYGEARIISRKDVNPEIVLASEQVIVGLNRTREQYNARIRTLLGRMSDAPVQGDKLICLRNDREKGVFNGTMWEALDIEDADWCDGVEIGIKSLDEPNIPAKKVTVLNGFFNGKIDKSNWKARRGTQEFTFGYAITCHKSQGSQWNNVTVFDESGSFPDSSKRWLYTAVTRAAEKLTLVLT
jgi:exodeoxyribonuclease-5